MIRNRFAIVLMAALAACGDAESDSASDATAQAADTSIRPVEREPLTAADFADLDRADLSVEVPWTRNVVNRTKAPAAPRSLVEAVAVSGHEGFDRVLFTFSMDAPFPGYRAELVDADTEIGCGVPEAAGDDEPEHDDAEAHEGEDSDAGPASELAGDRVLVVRIDPGWNADNGRTWVELGTDTHDLTRIREAGVVCSQDDLLVFVAGLAEGTDVRVLELRNPQRLAVDIR